jgi:hypothetical protein
MVAQGRPAAVAACSVQGGRRCPGVSAGLAVGPQGLLGRMLAVKIKGKMELLLGSVGRIEERMEIEFQIFQKLKWIYSNEI